MIVVSHIAQAFTKIAERLPKQDWFTKERLLEIVRQAVYGPTERRMREKEAEDDFMASGMGKVILADIADGPDEPKPR